MLYMLRRSTWVKPQSYKRLFAATIVLFPILASAQSISVAPAGSTATVEDYVENVLLGPCVTASNVTYVGTPQAAGTFNANGSAFDLSGGIVLTSGLSATAVGPDNSNTIGTANGAPGDSDLSILASNFQTYDAAILEFDFVPQSDTLRFNYIFGSEEYPEYVGSGYNDVFGFFISGPGFAGPYTGGAENIALIPGTTSPVAINNLNNGYSATEPANGPCNNCAFYVDNSSGPAVQYDAHTVVLTAEAIVTPCETYHIKIAIADAGDGALDSGVFLEEGSFSAVGEEPVELAVVPGLTGVYEGCNTNSFVFRRLPGASNTQPLTVNYSVSGTATPGVDYTALPGTATIPAGEDSIVISLDVALDFTPEGNETVVLSLPTGGCSCTAPTPVSLDIFDNDTQLSLSTSGATTICLGQSANLTANPAGSITPYTSGWDNGAPAGNNVSVSPTNTTTYTYTVTDACGGQSLTSTETITVVRPDFTVDDDQQCLDGNLFSFTNTGATGGTVTHFWDFGDGNSSTDENPTHTYANDGTYTVTHDVIYVADGCTASATATIIVFDEPVITATVDQNVACAGDNDGAVSTTVSGGTPTFDYSWLPIGQTTANISGLAPGNYTVTVIDANGCSDNDQVSVIQTDSELPIALCQNGDAYVDTAGIATISATLVDNGSSDNCGLSSLVVSPNAFDCSQLGGNPVVLTATDVNGNVSTCNATVTVLDTVSPTVTCQDVSVSLNGSGVATITVADVQVSADDNCALQNVSLNPTNFTCADVGTTTATLTATDASGNTASCQSVITVQESENPTAVCQDVTVQLDANGTVSVTGIQLGSGSTDNCGVASITATPSDFTCADIGPNSVTVEVTDNAGNTATCSATVTVEDNLAPNALCQDITIYLDAAGTATLNAADVDNGSDDNCAVASVSVSPTDFDCSNIGSNAVTLSVEDVNGNSSTCTANITVQDTIAPQAVCQDITVSLDVNGNATITEAQIDNGSSDNCSGVTLSLDQTSFDCSASSPVSVELTVADAAGNSSTCQAQVFLLENTPPTSICQNITVQLDASGNAVALAEDVDNGSTDNCGAVILDLLPSTFTCADLGENPVELIVTDGSGNTAVCSALVTVEDNVSPIAACQDISVALDAAGQVTILASDIENGSSDNCAISDISVSPGSFSCSDVGSQTVTLTVSDASGNTGTCTASVTVSDDVAPSAVCQDITVSVDASGSVTILPNDVDGGSEDACGIAALSLDIDQFDCSSLGANAVQLTVEDAAGNQSTCSATVTVEDDVVPSALCQNIDVYLDANGTATALASDADAGSTDNCAVTDFSLSQTVFSCADVGQQLLTLSVQDANGNTDDCVTVATILDTISPVIANCPNDTTIEPSSSQCSSNVSWSEPTASDNCSQTLVATHQPGEGFPVGTTTVTYTSEDPSGNISNCSFDVTVTPSELITSISAPTFPCGQNISCNGAEDGEATVTVSGGCEPYSYQWSSGQTTATAIGLNAGEHVVLVVDGLGNSTTDTIVLTEPEPFVADTLSTPEFVGGWNVSCYDAADGSISLNVSGGADCAAYSYNWSGPNGFTSTSEDLNSIEAGTYSVEVTDAHGCSFVNSIELFEPDSLQLTGFPNSYNGVNVTCFGAEDGAINLEVQGGTAGYTFSWSNAEITEDIDSLAAGNYSVLVTDTNGCQQSAVFILSEPDLLDVQLLSSEPVACNGDATGSAQVEVAGGIPLYSFDWSNGDTDATLNAVGAGTYQVLVSDLNGCADSLEVQIIEPDSMELTVLEVIDATCFGSEDGSVTIAAQGGSGIYEYLWQPTLQTTQSATELGAGEYIFIVTDSNGCSAQDTAEVNHPDQMVITTSADTTVCPGEVVELSASVTGGGGVYLISWENGQGFGETYQSIFNQTTNVGITATDQNGCEAIPNSIIVSTFAPVDADFEFTVPEPCVAPFEVQFANQTANANTFSWSFGNGESSTQFLPTTQYDTSGVFTVTLVAESSDGCVDTVTQNVSIAPLPVAAFNLPNSDGCFPIMVGHYNQSTGANSYLWDFGDGNQSDDGSPFHFYEEPGAYTVTLIATSPTGCTDTLSVDSAVVAFPRPTANFTAIQTLSETEREFTFNNTSVDGTEYFWTFGNGDFSEEFEPTYEYPEHGNYNVILYVQNEFGCEDTARFTLYADLVAELHVPNAVAPAEFGEAGLFLPKGTGIAQYHLWIFDEWGNQLWETRELIDGAPAEGWDGRYNGELVPQGMYVWKIEATFKDGMVWEGIETGDGQLKSVAGTVTVLY